MLRRVFRFYFSETLPKYYARGLRLLRSSVLPRLHEFGDSSWNMFLGAWIRDPEDSYRFRSELKCAIVQKFREMGVEIPFPQRNLHIRLQLPVPLTSQDPGQLPDRHLNSK